MTLTTVQAFNLFYEQVSLDDSTMRSVLQRQGAVETVLRKAFPPTSTMRFQSSTLMGSMAKKTASKPFEDIDLLVHIKVDDDLWVRSYQWNSRDFLARVRNTVNNKSLGIDRREALEMFFAHNAYNLSVYDPVGYSGEVSSYLTSEARSAVNRSMVAARDRAKLARAAENRGNHTEAKRLWGIVLGSRFPQL